MRTRGTRGGILLSLDADDTVENLESIYADNKTIFEGKVVLEIGERISWSLVSAVQEKIAEAGGELKELKPPVAVMQVKAETLIVTRTVRSGHQLESSGSLIIMGDVNAGAELIANDDIIVIGSLRGVAHAGASGNENAVIWAQRILSPQLRIAGALAQAGEETPEDNGAEIASLENGQIMLKPYKQLRPA